MAEYLTKIHHFLLNQPQLPRPRSGFYPSETSVVITNRFQQQEVIGRCLRQIYWKFKDEPSSNRNPPSTERKFVLGKATEEAEIELMKRAGIFIGNNLKFKSSYLRVSGEIDVVVELPYLSRVGIEIKSIWGYNSAAGCIKSTRDTPFFPKHDHLFQVMCYAYHFQREVPEQYRMKYFKILYLMRDTGEDAEHTITLNDNNVAIVNNNVTQFTIQQIKDRIEEFYGYYEHKQLPPRDYDYCYSKDKVKVLYDAGLLNKKDTETFKAGRLPEISDFQCRYCPFLNKCQEAGGNMRFPNTVCEHG